MISIADLPCTVRRLRFVCRMLWTVPLLLLVLAAHGSAVTDPFRAALEHRDFQRIGELLRHGADPNSATPDGKTALMFAAKAGRLGLVNDLLRAGANVNAVNRHAGTALMYAAQGGYLPVVQRLLEVGATVNATSTNGWTALTIASAKGYAPIVRLLLADGANPNVADVYGWTPLMRAVYEDRPACVAALLGNRRTAVNAANLRGQTALHLAVALGATAIVEQLLAAGADVAMRDEWGNTPLMMARQLNKNHIVNLLGAPSGGE